MVNDRERERKGEQKIGCCRYYYYITWNILTFKLVFFNFQHRSMRTRESENRYWWWWQSFGGGVYAFLRPYWIIILRFSAALPFLLMWYEKLHSKLKAIVVVVEKKNFFFSVIFLYILCGNIWSSIKLSFFSKAHSLTIKNLLLNIKIFNDT